MSPTATDCINLFEYLPHYLDGTAWATERPYFSSRCTPLPPQPPTLHTPPPSMGSPVHTGPHRLAKHDSRPDEPSPPTILPTFPHSTNSLQPTEVSIKRPSRRAANIRGPWRPTAGEPEPRRSPGFDPHGAIRVRGEPCTRAEIPRQQQARLANHPTAARARLRAGRHGAPRRGCRHNRCDRIAAAAAAAVAVTAFAPDASHAWRALQ